MKNKVIILLLIGILAMTGCGKLEKIKANEEDKRNSPVTIEPVIRMSENTICI